MPQRVQSLRSSTKNTRPAAGTREPGEIYTNWADLQLGVINASKAAQDLIAVRFFSAATNYAEGDFVIQAGRGYRAKGPIVSGPFNAADWETLSIIGESEPPIAAGTTADYWRGDKSWQTLDKAAVGLSEVNNTSDANKPVSAATQTALNLKANIASPTLTGDPKSVTPAYPNSTTSIATTAFVSANFAPITSPVFLGDPTAPTPATADNDQSVATTAYVKANLVNYAPLTSPAFLGNPTAPTPPGGDASTRLATTAFVTSSISSKPDDAPADGQSYGRRNSAWVDVAEEAPNDGVSYGRKNGAWVASVGGAVVSDMPPPGPLIVGQLWYEADSGNTYLWYSDADSSQWVQVNVQPAPVTPLPATGTAQTRSRLVNGAMQVSQENGSTGVATTGSYGVDQWQANWVSTGTYTSQRVPAVTPNGSVNRLRLSITGADAVLAAGDFLHLSQKVEGIRVADFKYGTAGAMQSVLRFGFRAPAGTYSVFIQNSAQNRSWVASLVIAVGQANTDTVQTFVIPGDITGTWLVDTGVGLTFGIAIAAGTTFQGAAGWQVGSFFGTSANTNGMTPGGAVYELYDVGLYLDPANTGKAPDWTMPDEAEELRACQRYYNKIDSYLVSGYVPATSTTVYADVVFPARMRIAPASTFTGTVTLNTTQVDHIRVQTISGGAGVVIAATNMALNARM